MILQLLTGLALSIGPAQAPAGNPAASAGDAGPVWNSLGILIPPGATVIRVPVKSETALFEPAKDGKDLSKDKEKDKENGNGKDKDKENGNGKDKDKEKPKPNVSGNGNWRDDGTGNGSAIFGPRLPNGPEGKGFFQTFLRAYVDEFRGVNTDDSPPSQRRANPEPWSSPPFPGHEYQGYPLIGVPPSTTVYPFMKGIYSATDGTYIGDCIKDSRIKLYGWATASGNFSTSSKSNIPTAYWVVPNSFQLDQFVVRLERELDSVQTDHIDWGFRSTYLYGIDYRFMTAGGWFSDQLIRHNQLNGFDPTEQYGEVYIPGVAQGLIVRMGRWVACPDIETQFAPDNYMASHSLLFTFDTYTQTGLLATMKLSNQWMVQLGLTAGTDMAPWYPGATPTGFAAVRWTSKDNNDAVYTVLNNINDARFRRVEVDGQFAGHDNFNYIVSTWEHRFNALLHTKTEGYFMWQRDAYQGGSVSIGPPQSFGGGGGAGAYIPGYSLDYGILNYTMLAVGKNDYITLRNELWNDPQGERTGTRNLYSSHAIGWSHNFNSYFQIRPEIGYYEAYKNPAFDLATKRGMLMGGFDVTWRF